MHFSANEFALHRHSSVDSAGGAATAHTIEIEEKVFELLSAMSIPDGLAEAVMSTTMSSASP